MSAPSVRRQLCEHEPNTSTLREALAIRKQPGAEKLSSITKKLARPARGAVCIQRVCDSDCACALRRRPCNYVVATIDTQVGNTRLRIWSQAKIWDVSSSRRRENMPPTSINRPPEIRKKYLGARIKPVHDNNALCALCPASTPSVTTLYALTVQPEKPMTAPHHAFLARNLAQPCAKIQKFVPDSSKLLFPWTSKTSELVESRNDASSSTENRTSMPENVEAAFRIKKSSTPWSL